MEGKHNEIVSENDDDSMIIENTNNLFHFGQDNSRDKSYIKTNNKRKNDEVTYPFRVRIKIKHELEAAPQNKPVKYTADIIVEKKLIWHCGTHDSLVQHRNHIYHYSNRRG
jgi:hypothetical protein